MSNLDKDSSDFLKNLMSSQQMEQAEAGAKQLAAIVRAYQQALKAEGFNSVEALTLAANFQQVVLTNANEQGK